MVINLQVIITEMCISSQLCKAFDVSVQLSSLSLFYWVSGWVLGQQNSGVAGAAAT